MQENILSASELNPGYPVPKGGKSLVQIYSYPETNFRPAICPSKDNTNTSIVDKTPQSTTLVV